MATLFLSGIPDLPQNGSELAKRYRNWQHSTFVQRSYKRVGLLFERIVKHIKEELNEDE